MTDVHGDNLTDSSEEDVYRLLPAEPSARDEPIPDQNPFFAEETPPPPRTKKRKRKRRPADSGGDVEPPPPPPADTEEEREWVADTGWRDRALISALWYPFTGSGWWLLPCYAAFLAMAIVPLVGSLFGLIGAILVSSLLLVTANYTLEGIPAGPQFPDLLSMDAIVAALMGLVAFMISGVPTLLGLWLMSLIGLSSPTVAMILTLALTAVGFFYAPMGFLALASEQNDHALNPLAVFRGIRNMLVSYLVLWAVGAVAYVSLLTLVYLMLPENVLIPCSGLMLIYVATALLRAVALVARKQELTFE